MTLSSRIGGGAQIGALAGGGLATLLVKTSAAGLGFAMFLVLSRAMPAAEFGHFGTAFSLATFLAVLGSLGQRSLVLRYASAYRGTGRPEALRAVVRRGYAVVASGCAACGFAALALPLLPSGAWSLPLALATGVLTLVLGLAEYQAHVLRALGPTWLALLPRDVLWRLAMGLFAVVVLAGAMRELSAVSALVAMAGLLLLIALLQAALHPGLPRALHLPGPGGARDKARWRRAAPGLWGTSVVQAAGPALALVIAGFMLPPEETGRLFAALRVAMVLQLFPLAANLVVAPMLSVASHRGEAWRAARLRRAAAFGAGAPTLLLFAAFVVSGEWTLELFGEGFAAAYPALILLGLGNLAAALCGPTAQMMEMAGHERAYLAILIAVTLLALAALPGLIVLSGSTGAAFAIGMNTAGWNIAVLLFLRRHAVTGVTR